MDRSKSKFDSDTAEELYAETPDNDIGSVDELGWAGRFDDELIILIEDSDGFVWSEEHRNRFDLFASWEAIEAAYEAFDLGLRV